MDLSDFNKVTSRKRMNTDAEQLREIVSRDTAKIVKLKVAQGTACWNLKECLQQLEGVHERLQQNIVDVQMQHEAASAYCARELQLRLDTLNKMGATRDMCDVIEEYGAALGTAYAQCSARLRRLVQELAKPRADAAHQHATADRATERAAAADAHRLGGTLQQPGEVRVCAREQQAACEELAARLARTSARLSKLEKDMELQMRSLKQELSTLEAEKLEVFEQLNKSIQECNTKSRAVEELKATIIQLTGELGEARVTLDTQREADTKKIEELKSAVTSQQRELEANSSSIAYLMNDLKMEADARLRAEASHDVARRKAEAEREAARATEKALRDSVARLDATVKDLRQQQIEVKQNTIDDHELTGRPLTPTNRSAAMDVSEPPDVGPQRPELSRVNDLLFDFSDDSGEDNRPDAQAVAQRFEELRRTGVFDKAPHRRQPQGSTSLSLVKEDMKIKSRRFFKTKRTDTRTNKLNTHKVNK